jgi:hypothetical protein
MQPRITLSVEQVVRDELALQRRLGACRRAASALMPTLQRTGMHKNQPSSETSRPPKKSARRPSDRP